MEQKQTATQLIRKYINEINLIISKQSAAEQLDLINTYTNNIGSLITNSKTQFISQLSTAYITANKTDKADLLQNKNNANYTQNNYPKTKIAQIDQTKNNTDSNNSTQPLIPIKPYSTISPKITFQIMIPFFY